MKVLTWPNEFLTRVATPVPHGERCREIIDVMFESMSYPEGIGLAAPQIGEDKRIIVIRVPSFKNGKRVAGDTKHAIINPEITWWKGAPVLGYEGCLSFEGEQVLVPRWPRIKVEGYDLRWNRIVIGGKGLVARVLSHEIDHLNGRTLDFYAKMAEKILDEKEDADAAKT